jgi:hypothetical protein
LRIAITPSAQAHCSSDAIAALRRIGFLTEAAKDEMTIMCGTFAEAMPRKQGSASAKSLQVESSF